MTAKQSELLKKAERSLQAAEDLLGNGHTDFSASRTYYAYFYTAEALLLSLDLAFSTHAQVLGQYGLHFSKTRILDPAYHRLLMTAFDLRNLSDYQVEVAIEGESVVELIQRGYDFISAAYSHLERLSDGSEDGGRSST